MIKECIMILMLYSDISVRPMQPFEDMDMQEVQEPASLEVGESSWLPVGKKLSPLELVKAQLFQEHMDPDFIPVTILFIYDIKPDK